MAKNARSIFSATVAAAACALAVSVGTGATPTPKPGPGGLTAAQRDALSKLAITAVVPDPVPAGFKVSRVVADAASDPNYYKIVYAGPSGSTMTFEGRKFTATPSPKPKSGGGGGFNPFKGLSGLMHPSPSATSESNTGHEQEEHEGEALMADSSLIGPASFNSTASDCLAGNSDQTKSKLPATQFTVSACHLAHVETLISAYRSVTSIASH